MSREIRFRAWDKGHQRMIHLKPHTMLAYDAEDAKLVFGENFHDDFTSSGTDNFDLMQFTGLKDEKGKEIYEGDIIKLTGAFDEQIAQVFWGRSHDSYTWVTGETWLIRILKGHVVGSEGSLLPYCEYRHGFWVHIIGNIYENPELVEMRG